MLNNEASREALKKAKRIVIKVGTSTITYANGKRNFSQIDRLAREISAITGCPLKMPAMDVKEAAAGKASDYVNVKIDAPELCPENPKLFPASRPLLP